MPSRCAKSLCQVAVPSTGVPHVCPKCDMCNYVLITHVSAFGFVGFIVSCFAIQFDVLPLVAMYPKNVSDKKHLVAVASGFGWFGLLDCPGGCTDVCFQNA